MIHRAHARCTGQNMQGTHMQASRCKGESAQLQRDRCKSSFFGGRSQHTPPASVVISPHECMKDSIYRSTQMCQRYIMICSACILTSALHVPPGVALRVFGRRASGFASQSAFGPCSCWRLGICKFKPCALLRHTQCSTQATLTQASGHDTARV